MDDARIPPQLPFTNATNIYAVIDGAKVMTRKSKEGQTRVLRLSTLKALAIERETAHEQACKTDGQVVDERLRGKPAYYRLFFLTGYNRHAGSRGPFYVQLKGTFGTTSLQTFWPLTDEGQWAVHGFVDTYVGKISTIRLAAGTSDGWCPWNIIVLYPRGHVWVVNHAWAETDGTPVIEIVL